MSNYAGAILDACDILMNSKTQSLRFDRTMTGEIIKVVDLDSGEYRVSIQGGEVTAYSLSVDTVYKVGEAVFIKIPEGDMTQRKIIEGRTRNIRISEQERMALQNAVETIGPEWRAWFEYPETGFGICAGVDKTSELFSSTIYKKDTDNKNGTFEQYANYYSFFRIKAEFQTLFQTTYTSGQYGLKVVLIAADDKEIPFYFYCSEFNGDAYGFIDWAPQEIIIPIQTNYFKGLKSIELVQDGLKLDKKVVDGTPLDDAPIDNIKNIFVRKIEMQFVEINDLTEYEYYLSLLTPNGTIFSETTTKISVEPKLFFRGNSVDEDDCDYFLYERDLSVTVSSDAFAKDAGIGWRFVKKAKIFEFLKSDCLWQKEYKIVAYYKNTVNEKEFMLLNANSSYDLYIVQETLGNNVRLKVEDKKAILPKTAKATWYLTYPDGSYETKESEDNLSLFIENYLIYKTIKFSCSIKDGEEFVGNLYWVINSSESAEDIEVSYEGDMSFQYDEKGDISSRLTEQEQTISCSIRWKDGVATGYTLSWKGPDGEDIPKSQDVNEPYNPVDSMMYNMWIDADNKVHFRIARKFKRNATKNTITPIITTIDGNIYDGYGKTISFIKQGDPGTNGTTYTCQIEAAPGCKKYYYMQNGAVNNYALKAIIRKDGEDISGDDNYDINKTWSLVNAKGHLNSDGTYAVSGISSDDEAKEYYAKLEVNITENSSGQVIQLHSFHSIDLVYGNELMPPASSSGDINLDLASIPTYVQYSASGYSPDYSNSSLSATKDGVSFEDYISLNEKLVKIVKTDGVYTIRPASKYISDEIPSSALIQCNYNNNNYILRTIVLYLNTYGNEALNGWDGQKLVIKQDDDGDDYILAPQIGAGKKESDNSFTGLVMGTSSSLGDGLFGFRAGAAAFGLKTDGSAFFGEAGSGRIQIDGNTAKIFGGMSVGEANSMVLTLKAQGLTKNTKAIEIKGDANSGNSVFSVDYTGAMSATGATITGKITATELTATVKGTIAGWSFDSGKLYYGNSIYISPTSGLKFGSRFSVDRYGNLSASNVSIGGIIDASELYASEGTIGGWTLNSTSLYSTGASNTYISSNYGIRTDKMQISYNGTVIGGLGMINGQDDAGVTNNMGLYSTGSSTSIILQSSRNIALRAYGSTGWIFLQGDKLSCQIPASGQTGIYARFA